MRTFSKEEIDIMKDAIKEYDYLARYINYEIKNGASMEQLLDYLETEFDYLDITNYDLESDFKYIDFNAPNITCTIVSSKELPTTFSKYIEIWNDEDNYIIESSTNIDELREEVNK